MAETRKDVILSFISWVLLLILAIGGLGVIARDDAYQLPGDGFEYLMMPVSIVNHGSTDVTQQDIDDAKAYYGNNIFDTIYRDREDITLVEGADGNYYAKHFGLYSVLCMPLRSLFHYIGINPAKAYQYMNLLFWFLACLMVQLVLKAEQSKKTMLMLFMVLNPAWFYITWVHTEVLAMLLMSIAAMNNLALLVPAFFLGIEFLIVAYKDSGKKIGTVAKQSIPVLVAAIPGFVPVVRSFILFGSYSPVASVAAVSNSDVATDNRLICALSYIFDPNQGMIAYTLLIAPAFFVIVILNLIKKKEIAFTVLSLLTVLCMLFIVSQEMHINCGMAYIMRYNVWMLPFMAFFNVFNIRESVAAPVFCISSAWTAFVLIFVALMYPHNLYLDHTFIGRFVIDNFPTLYNPPVGIYYSRTLSEESYYCKYPVPYFDEDGNLNINGEAFTYVNISSDGYHMVRDTDTLDFSDLTQNDMSLIRSSVGYEGDVALVYGKQLHLCLHMLPGTYTGRFGLANVFGGEQYITVRVNGDVVYEGPVTMDDDSFGFVFTVGDDYQCDLVIDIPNAFSPMSVIEGNTDDRVLSLYLEDFVYVKEF